MNTTYMKLSNILKRENKILLRELVVTDFKLRYQGSVLGYMWSVLKPLFLFAILYIVFDKFLRLGRNIEHFPVYLLIGVVLWSFFVEATNNGLRSIVSRGGLIRKINFPKYIVVISGTISSLINLGINLVVIVVFMLVNGVAFSFDSLMIIPLIVELYIFALAIAFFLAALNVKFRDVGYLWDIFLQAAFYATPIIYPLQMIFAQSELAAKLIMFSPVAQVIQDARYFVVTADSIRLADVASGTAVWMPLLIIAITSLLAVFYFKRSQGRFAELV